MRPPLPTSVADSIRAGLLLEHGRLQPLDASTGAVTRDACLTRVQPEWRPALDAALREWLALPEAVPSLSLISVYARGSLPRGLALPGISDVDTLGFATFSSPQRAGARAVTACGTAPGAESPATDRWSIEPEGRLC